MREMPAMRREGAIWMSRGQLGAALVLVSAVCTATFFLGYLLGEGGSSSSPMPARSEVDESQASALIGPELEQDTLTELLARVDLVPNAEAATLEFPSELSAPELVVEAPVAPEEIEAPPAQVLPAPQAEPVPPSEPTDAVKGGWSLEVASYKSREEAEASIQLLEDEGLAASLASVLYGGETHFRVRVGPFKDAETAQALAGEVGAVVGHGVDLVEVR